MDETALNTMLAEVTDAAIALSASIIDEPRQSPADAAKAKRIGAMIGIAISLAYFILTS